MTDEVDYYCGCSYGKTPLQHLVSLLNIAMMVSLKILDQQLFGLLCSYGRMHVMGVRVNWCYPNQLKSWNTVVQLGPIAASTIVINATDLQCFFSFTAVLDDATFVPVMSKMLENL